ncbi:thiamine pyrophosphate-binding protein [Nocardioides sp. LHD-245]|uniref:thiamine pyrophosphate-binding protein n=1 Tax=Nocardioides sp. LHD-245 TaxID=3051387 RepID=UPI0027DF1CA7|nr:thiamine pyrophosphate-binding protein [Nocardioides sp. LHD-245]
MTHDVSTAVARTLLASGVETITGLMGDGNLPHVVAFIEHGGRFVPTVAESGAVSAADGMARTTAGLGAASVTHGPGFTNTLTALTEAVRARSPLLLLTGDTPSVPHHLQRFDLAAAARLTGAAYVRVTHPDDAVGQLARAMRHAEERSRPVVFDIPLDLATAPCGESVAAVSGDRPALLPDDASLDAALGIVASARRPVVLAGRGAGGAREELLSLAGQLGAPVATTLLAKGMFAGEHGDLGVCGTVGRSEALRVLAESDCVVAFGASLNRFTTADGLVGSRGAVVQIDSDPDAIGRYGTPAAALVGDAGITAGRMCALLAESGPAAPYWPGAQAPPVPVARGAGGGEDCGLELAAALRLVDDALPADRLVVSDTGRFVYTAWRELNVAAAGDFVHTLNFASIGLGIATGMGVSLAHRDRLTLVVAGDGGAMMGLSELATAVRERLPLLVLIANDAAYGMEFHHLRGAGRDPDHARMAWPDFADVARGYGAQGHTVRSAAELRKVLDTLDPLPAGPVVLALELDPATIPGE